MNIFEAFKRNRIEKPIERANYTAACGEINPIELYYSEKGYPYNCRKCGLKATNKMLFLSPKGEVEGLFGPAYFCQNHVPDINQVAINEKLYFEILYEGR